jgi:membrane fusion protein (multidrug efflux system)
VPVRIALEPQEIARHPLRIGLSMRVVVDTRERGGAVLSTPDAPAIVYKTTVFDKELAQANALVESVIRENEGASAANASAQGTP